MTQNNLNNSQDNPVNSLNNPIQPKRRRKNLSDSEKLIIKSKHLAGISISDLKNEFQVTDQTIHNVISQKNFEIMSNKSLENLKKSLISHSYANAFQAQNSVTQEKMDSSSLVQLGVFSKISIEVARLLEEKSTQNIAIHNLNQSINDELSNLREKISNLDNNIPLYAHSPSKQMSTNDNQNEQENNQLEIETFSQDDKKEK